MSTPFTACVVQPLPGPYDKAGNLRRALDWMEQAAARGASLIVFPEMFLTGYLIKDRLAELTESLPDSPSLRVLGERAKALSLAVVMGLPLADPDSGRPWNAMVFLDRDGRAVHAAAKTHMFGGEEKMFSRGESLRAFDTSLGRVGLLVCYDGEFPETARTLALDGAKLLILSSANMTPYEDYHPVYMRARAMENCAYTLYSNYVGRERRFHYCGQSGAWHPTGKVLAQADTETPGLYFAQVDMNQTTSPDDFLNYLDHRRPELYACFSDPGV